MLLSITGLPEKGGIPRSSDLRIESMPGRRVVFQGKCSKAANIDLDPGKYTVAVVKMVKGRKDQNVAYSYIVMNGLTDEQWKKFQFQSATRQKVMFTSSGFRWRCKWPACDGESTSSIGAYIHECEVHFGIDPIQASESNITELKEKADAIREEINRMQGEKRNAALEGRQADLTEANVEPAKRGRGRPRKAVV